MTMEFSKFLQINFRDFAYGVLMVVLGAFVTAVYEALQDGSISGIELKNAAIGGAVAGLAYIIKNFFSNSKGEFGTKE